MGCGSTNLVLTPSVGSAVLGTRSATCNDCNVRWRWHSLLDVSFLLLIYLPASPPTFLPPTTFLPPGRGARFHQKHRRISSCATCSTRGTLWILVFGRERDKTLNLLCASYHPSYFLYFLLPKCVRCCSQPSAERARALWGS